MNFMAELIFSGLTPEDDDPEGAAVALHRAGFEVHRNPEIVPEAPCDHFFEVLVDGPSGPPPDNEWSAEVSEACKKFKTAVETALESYGGFLFTCGPVDADYEPFVDPHYWGEPLSEEFEGPLQ